MGLAPEAVAGSEQKRPNENGKWAQRFPGRQIPCLFSETEIALAKRLTTADRSGGGLSHKILWLDSATESLFSQRGREMILSTLSRAKKLELSHGANNVQLVEYTCRTMG